MRSLIGLRFTEGGYSRNSLTGTPQPGARGFRRHRFETAREPTREPAKTKPAWTRRPVSGTVLTVPQDLCPRRKNTTHAVRNENDDDDDDNAAGRYSFFSPFLGVSSPRRRTRSSRRLEMYTYYTRTHKRTHTHTRADGV